MLRRSSRFFFACWLCLSAAHLMDFSPFDTRNYPTVDVATGYQGWAETYERSVHDEMDLRLLARLTSVRWAEAEQAADLACGTGRIGAWMRMKGVQRIDGVDLVEEMLEQARNRAAYDRLEVGDVRETPLPEGSYDLVIQCLADEHLPALAPLYREAARLLRSDDAPPHPAFIIVGYHPHFLMLGKATHYHCPDGSPVAIESHVHLLSDHLKAARAAGLSLAEMEEGVVDDDWIAVKPQWSAYRHHPVSFAMVFRK